VRVEFALHCIAFNLKKVAGGPLLVLLTLSFRFSGRPWRPVVAVCFQFPAN
jgi:hypothetical protein